jgi:hypothetical protein
VEVVRGVAFRRPQCTRFGSGSRFSMRTPEGIASTMLLSRLHGFISFFSFQLSQAEN